MNDEIKEILDKLSNRKQETLLQGIRECQLKDIEHPFITKEEYIDKVLDYITTLQKENEQLKKRNKEIYDDYKKEKYLVDKLTRQLTDEYKNTEYQQKEIERLNNIINEIRELADKYEIGKYDYNVPSFEIKEILDKENKQ